MNELERCSSTRSKLQCLLVEFLSLCFFPNSFSEQFRRRLWLRCPSLTLGLAASSIPGEGNGKCFE